MKKILIIDSELLTNLQTVINNDYLYGKLIDSEPALTDSAQAAIIDIVHYEEKKELEGSLHYDDFEL